MLANSLLQVIPNKSMFLVSRWHSSLFLGLLYFSNTLLSILCFENWSHGITFPKSCLEVKYWPWTTRKREWGPARDDFQCKMWPDDSLHFFFFFFGQSGWAKGECLSEGWKEGSLSSAMMLKPLVLFLSLVMRFLALKWMVGMHFLWWNMHRILDLDFVV